MRITQVYKDWDGAIPYGYRLSYKVGKNGVEYWYLYPLNIIARHYVMFYQSLVKIWLTGYHPMSWYKAGKPVPMIFKLLRIM